MERVLKREFSWLGAYTCASAGFFVAWSMYLVNRGKSAYATLPTQRKSTLLPRVPKLIFAPGGRCPQCVPYAERSGKFAEKGSPCTIILLYTNCGIGIHGALPSYQIHLRFSAAVLAVLMVDDHLCFDRQQKTHEKQILSVSFLKDLLQLWKVHVAELLFENATPVSSHPTDSWLLSCSKQENMLTAPFKSCWRLHRSFPCPTSGPTLLPECQTVSATATLRICATADYKHVQETHLDQSVLVSAVRTNRKIIQPSWQLEESCQDTTKRSYHKRQMLHMDAYGMYSWTNTPSHKFVREEEWATETIQSNMLQTELSNFQRAAWNDSVLSRSDTSLTLGEFRHKDTCLVLVWWGAELAKLCKMLRSVSIKGFKTVVAIYAVEGPVSSVQSQYDLLQWWKVNELLFENANCSCLKPLLLKWSAVKPGSTVSPLVFGGEMEVAACFFPESEQNEGPSATQQRRYALQGVQNESKI